MEKSGTESVSADSPHEADPIPSCGGGARRRRQGGGAGSSGPRSRRGPPTRVGESFGSIDRQVDDVVEGAAHMPVTAAGRGDWMGRAGLGWAGLGFWFWA